MSSNTSGYRGVSWHKQACKWGAYIQEGGVRQYLGLFDTAEEASRAYNLVAEKFRPCVDPVEERRKLLTRVRDLYQQHGFKALSTRFLYKQSGNLGARLRKAELQQPTLLKELGLTSEYAAWRNSARTYRGVTKPKWSWEAAIAKAREIVECEGELPTVEQCRLTGLSSLTNAVHHAGKTWEELRAAVGLTSDSFYPSRKGIRWRSRPEACLSNFLYARDIQHKRGERYPAEFSKQSGRRWALYDLHFLSPKGSWIDVEVWGDAENKLSGGRYQETRLHKEKWAANNPNFIGIPYKDCLKDALLEKALERHLGVIAPFVFDLPSDREIETAHWSNSDELLATCRAIAAEMPGGIFPAEDWLRKRGKHADRPGRSYNTVAARVSQWLKGVRNVRRLLGQGDASTIEWTPEFAIQAWHEFERKYGLSPSQCEGSKRRSTVSSAVLNEARRIYQASARLGVRALARNGTTKRVKWTPERTLTAWRDFITKHGCSPTECMSRLRRQTLPRAITDEATNIYGAARRAGVLEQARTMEISMTKCGNSTASDPGGQP
jgi:hypothetical protein